MRTKISRNIGHPINLQIQSSLKKRDTDKSLRKEKRGGLSSFKKKKNKNKKRRLEEAKTEYGLKLISRPKSNYYDAIVLAVSHAKFKDMGIKKIKSFGKKNHVIYDLKYIFTAKDVDLRLAS